MKKISKLLRKLFLTGMFVMPVVTNLNSEQNYNSNISQNYNHNVVNEDQKMIKALQIFQRAYRNNSKSIGIYKEVMPGSDKILFFIAYDMDKDKQIDVVEVYNGQKYTRDNETRLYVNDNPFLYMIDKNKNGDFEPNEILHDPQEDLLNFNEIPMTRSGVQI